MNALPKPLTLYALRIVSVSSRDYDPLIIRPGLLCMGALNAFEGATTLGGRADLDGVWFTTDRGAAEMQQAAAHARLRGVRVEIVALAEVAP